ncbi:MAG: hypothetical protein QM619_13770 [Micropruina sp.]|uniref:hypothetical protein n=1 Tax=Micropruina sp. TaxID=2737536 RepID=UPI0039E37728
MPALIATDSGQAPVRNPENSRVDGQEPGDTPVESNRVGDFRDRLDRGGRRASALAFIPRRRPDGSTPDWSPPNDNTRALRSYQRAGWDLVALHRDAMDDVRRLKPGVPRHGMDGIPLRHQLELEFPLN